MKYTDCQWLVTQTKNMCFWMAQLQVLSSKLLVESHSAGSEALGSYTLPGWISAAF